MKRPAWADVKRAFEGKRYGISCTWQGDGEVFNYDENSIELKFHNEPAPKSSMYGVVQLPEFIVTKQNGIEGWRFRRTRRLFPQAFEIWADGHRVGEVVRKVPILRNYNVNLSNGDSVETIITFIYDWVFWIDRGWWKTVILAEITSLLAVSC